LTLFQVELSGCPALEAMESLPTMPAVKRYPANNGVVHNDITLDPADGVDQGFLPEGTIVDFVVGNPELTV
jgi:hypothetical protein